MDLSSSDLPGVSLKEALATAKANDAARVLGRDEDNRMEPECWPVVRPSFQFSKDHKFFTIGSCFAGNIARRLEADGYNVHKKGRRRTRYTPPSIVQEIEWAAKIFQRDGIVTGEDVEPLLIETAPDRYSDLWNRPGKDPPADMKTAVERRQAIYDWLSGAFEADVVVITLGLIEAWYDTVTKSYVEFDSGWLRRRDRDRFRLEILSFEKCKSAVRRTLELLLDGNRRILMTTSPVVLARTFTNKDIIIANNHSKSVLRAVAGELSDELDGVDYFPSYEIATIGSRPQVWEDDLRHVKPNFVARIMQYVTNVYVPGSVSDETSSLMQMANLVDAGDLEAAAKLYDRLADSAEQSTDNFIHAASIRLTMNRGETAAAVRHARRFDPRDDRLYLSRPAWMLEVARALSASEADREIGDEIFSRLKALCASRPAVLMPFLIDRERARDDNGVRFVLEIIEEMPALEPATAMRTYQKLKQMGEADRAMALARRQVERDPDNIQTLSLYAKHLLQAGHSADAIEPLRKIVALEPGALWAYLGIARSCFAEQRFEEALEAIEVLLAQKPDDADGLAFKARALSRLGRHEEAKENARAAATASNGDARMMRKLQNLLDA